uniref:Uncharacterized protein n=1 Tax=Rhizophora mucronata TaxID=61149 RepID=A0A2P2MZM9_RHIMU
MFCSNVQFPPKILLVGHLRVQLLQAIAKEC